MSRIVLKFDRSLELVDTLSVPIFEAGGAEFNFTSLTVHIFDSAVNTGCDCKQLGKRLYKKVANLCAHL
jgi:hypothetical protein